VVLLPSRHRLAKLRTAAAEPSPAAELRTAAAEPTAALEPKARAAVGAPGDSRRALRLFAGDTSRLRRSGSGRQRIPPGEVRDEPLSTDREVVQELTAVCAAGHQRGVARSGVGTSVCAHKYAVADPPIDDYSDEGRAMMTDQNEE
jgi:erythromycin esterase-like protein